MRKCLLAFFSTFLLIGLLGCSESKDAGLVQIDFTTFEKMTKGELDGFILPVNDYEKISLEYIQKALEKNDAATIFLYYTFQPDGKDGEILERQQYVSNSNMRKNDLYFIKDGEIKENLNLDGYNGEELTKEIEYLLEVYKNE
jgi:hypothetical protein